MNNQKDLFSPRILAVLIAAGFLALWEASSRAGMISPLLAPAPSAIVSTIFREFSSGEIIPHIAITLYRVMVGILIGGTIGVGAGLLMGMSRRLRQVADPFVAAIHPIPKIAILPVVMALLGIGDLSRITVISLAVFFPMMINTMNGVRQINRTHLDVARNYGASGFRMFRRVVLPASLPMVLSGLRIAVNLALLITISIEIAGANEGLGSLIWNSWEVMRIEVLYATLIVIMLFGITLTTAVRALTDVLVPWSSDRRR
jgi:NitT/TauT family transport system permease protein